MNFLIIILSLALFSLDWGFRFNVAICVLYAVPVWLAGNFSSRRFMIFTAGFGCLLTLTGFWIATNGTAPISKTIINPLLGLVAIGMVTGLSLLAHYQPDTGTQSGVGNSQTTELLDYLSEGQGKKFKIAPESMDDFVLSTTRSGLLDQADLENILEEYPEPPTDTGVFVNDLVEKEILTKYQATLLFHGRESELKFGDFVVQDQVGRGGTGKVLKAYDKGTKKTVALKVLTASSEDSVKVTRRFQREIDTLKHLRHENIVAALEHGDQNGSTFLVMEFIDGEDMERRIQKNGPIGLSDAIGIIIQAARGLQYAHGKGVVHRDIKPGNMVQTSDGVVKIVDLGLVQVTENIEWTRSNKTVNLTNDGIFGTVDFMAPEQARDFASTDPRSDIFSLGATLFYLVTGDTLYGQIPVREKFQKLTSGIGFELPAFPDSQTGAIVDVFRRMAAFDPSQRYSSMDEVLQALEKIKADI